MLSALLTPGLGTGAFAVGTSRRMRSAVRPNSTVRIRPNHRPQHSCSRPLHTSHICVCKALLHCIELTVPPCQRAAACLGKHCLM